MNELTEKFSASQNKISRRELIIGVASFLAGSLLTRSCSIPNPFDSLGKRVADKEVFAFLETRQIEDLVDLNKLQMDKITTLSVFGIPVAVDGSLDTNSSEYSSVNLEKSKTLLKIADDKNVRRVLTLTQFDDSFAKIANFLDSPKAQEKSIDQMLKEIKRLNYRGVNLDWEFFSLVDDNYRKRFTDYVSKVSEAVHKEDNNSQVSVSVGVLSGKYKRLWDCSELAKHADLLFIMGYGFADQFSTQAIPTAPLYGYDSGSYLGNLSESTEFLLKQIPGSKLILGLPLFGYQYPTTGSWVGAPAKGTGVTLTYSQAVLKNKLSDSVIVGWDDESKMEWSATREGNTSNLLIVGGRRSLEERAKFITDKNLGGLGIWALQHFTYQSSNDEVWEVLKNYRDNKLNKKPDFTKADQRVERFTTFSQKDSRFKQYPTAEITFASVLNTFGLDYNPDHVSNEFIDRGVRKADGVYVRPNGLNWLSRELMFDVKKVFDKYDESSSTDERKKTFNFDVTKQLLDNGYIVIGSGDAYWNEEYPTGRSMIFSIIDVNKKENKITVFDPTNGSIRIVPFSNIDEFYYAYGVKPA